MEVEKILGIFVDEIKKLLPFQSFTFRSAISDVLIEMGHPAPHACHYRLIAENAALGQTALTRDTPFTAAELIDLENLLADLVYPLRNAVMYQHALRSSLKDALTGLYNRAAPIPATRSSSPSAYAGRWKKSLSCTTTCRSRLP